MLNPCDSCVWCDLKKDKKIEFYRTIINHLKTYGEHFPQCFSRNIPGSICTCGLDELIKSFEKEINNG